jgi:alcohol dehydrogenase class IV
MALAAISGASPKADPPSHVIEVAAKRARSEKIDLVLSIGGGSALDTAKLVAYLTKSDEALDATALGSPRDKGYPSFSRRRRPAPDRK